MKIRERYMGLDIYLEKIVSLFPTLALMYVDRSSVHFHYYVPTVKSLHPSPPPLPLCMRISQHVVILIMFEY